MNIVITGASRGIGKAIAEVFATEGNHLFICARNGEVLNDTAAGIRKSNPLSTINTFTADLSLKTEAIQFAEWCLTRVVPDILINNAGQYIAGDILDEPEGSLEKMMETNLYSAYYITRKLVPVMIKNGSGHIFNICSIAALQAYEGGGGYSISKYALKGFSQNLRNELKEHGIKVTAIFPGAVMTDTWGDFDNSSNRIMEAKDIAQMVLGATKLSRQAVVEDIIIRPQLGDL
ncbi:MAG TPA: SDR family oxidoreductase [Ferruginibacter sp.]|nr:SDR family oxidoreductase [Ferruginibacter sp.]